MRSTSFAALSALVLAVTTSTAMAAVAPQSTFVENDRHAAMALAFADVGNPLARTMSTHTSAAHTFAPSLTSQEPRNAIAQAFEDVNEPLLDIGPTAE
ncbi:hypothetical protein [Halomonas sp. WWR20]